MTMPEAEAIPFEPQDLRGERLLVLAPHPDDEVIGCGGLVALHLREGRKVHVVVATDGAQADRIEDCVVMATEAVESLRELTRGIYPTNLTRSGLGSALQSRAAAMRRADAVRIDPAAATARFAERVEAAAYYCCVEVLEHAAGEVRLTVDDRDDLVLVIHGVDVDALNRLAIVDRIEACGGALHLPDPESGALTIRFPALPPVPAPGPEGRLDPTTPAAGVPG